MTNKKRVIKWQFAEGYYKLLIEKLRRIEYFRLKKNYWAEFTELQSIFNDIIGKIIDDDPEVCQNFENMINDIEILETKFKNAIVEKDRSIQHIKICNNVEKDYKKSVNEFYKTLMKQIYSYEMLFPQETKDDRLPIYK